MTAYLDNPALVAALLDGAGHAVMTEALDTEHERRSSALSIGEATALATRLSEEEVLQNDLKDGGRLLCNRVAVVPADQAYLDRAARCKRERTVEITDSNHLATADRPRALTYITFDQAQLRAALSMGFDFAPK